MARQVVDEMYTRAAGMLAEGVGIDADRRELLMKAARFYERFALPQSTEPASAHSRRAGPACRAANILWKLGETGQAEAAYGKALGSLEAMVSANPADAESRRALAEGSFDVSDFYRTLRRGAECEATLRRSAELYRHLGGPRSQGRRASAGHGDCPDRAGEHPERGRSDRRGRCLLPAGHRAARRARCASTRGWPNTGSDLAMGWNSLADLERTLGRLPDAMASWGRALRRVRGAGTRLPRCRVLSSVPGAGPPTTSEPSRARSVGAMRRPRRTRRPRSSARRWSALTPTSRSTAFICPGPITIAATCCGTPVSWSRRSTPMEQAVAMRERLVLDQPQRRLSTGASWPRA